MDFKNLFLSFNGRTRRMHFWIGFIIVWVVEMVVFSVFIGGAMAAAASSGDPNAMSAALGGTGLIGCLVLLALIWPTLALYTNRWHDRNKSGWMTLILLIPIVGPLWALVELGFLDGTPGENKYGPSPKGITSAAPTAA
jgi:uncharacterized membrane protein YhaH (DUF805 family)